VVTRVTVTTAELRPGDRITLRLVRADGTLALPPFYGEVIHTAERLREGKIEIFLLRDDGATNIYDVAAGAVLEADRPGE
jgi:hypothetical protein